MEYKSPRMEIIEGIMKECQNSGDVQHIWRVRKEGKYYCVSPDDNPCVYRRKADDDSLHRYRCRRDDASLP